MYRLNGFAGVFADEVGQYVLRAFRLLVAGAIGEIWIKFKSNRPSYVGALAAVERWSDRLVQVEVQRMQQMFAQIDALLVPFFQSYARAINPNREVAFLRPPELFDVCKLFLQSICARKLVRSGAYFEDDAMAEVAASIVASDALRDTLDLFVHDRQFVKIAPLRPVAKPVHVEEHASDVEDDIKPSDSISNVNTPASTRRVAASNAGRPNESEKLDGSNEIVVVLEE